MYFVVINFNYNYFDIIKIIFFLNYTLSNFLYYIF